MPGWEWAETWEIHSCNGNISDCSLLSPNNCLKTNTMQISFVTRCKCNLHCFILRSWMENHLADCSFFSMWRNHLCSGLVTGNFLVWTLQRTSCELHQCNLDQHGVWEALKIICICLITTFLLCNNTLQIGLGHISLQSQQIIYTLPAKSLEYIIFNVFERSNTGNTLA